MTDQRESWSSYFLNLAAVTATRATCTRAKVGSVLVRDYHIVSTGFNGSPAGWDHCTDKGCHIIGGRCRRCVHAEINALTYAAKEGVRTHGTRLYCTLPPCLHCFMSCVSAGVTSFVWPADALPRDNEEHALILEWAHKYNINIRTHNTSHAEVENVC